MAYVIQQGCILYWQKLQSLSEVDVSKFLQVSALIIMPSNPWVEDRVGKTIKFLSLVFTLIICD